MARTDQYDREREEDVETIGRLGEVEAEKKTRRGVRSRKGKELGGMNLLS